MNGMDHAPEASYRGRGGIAGEILPVVDALQVHAALNEDAGSSEYADFTWSDFAHDRLADTARHAETVLGLAGSHLSASLADNDLTPERLAAHSTKVSNYRGMLGPPAPRPASAASPPPGSSPS